MFEQAQVRLQYFVHQPYLALQVQEMEPEIGKHHVKVESFRNFRTARDCCDGCVGR